MKSAFLVDRGGAQYGACHSHKTLNGVCTWWVTLRAKLKGRSQWSLGAFDQTTHDSLSLSQLFTHLHIHSSDSSFRIMVPSSAVSHILLHEVLIKNIRCSLKADHSRFQHTFSDQMQDQNDQ